MAKLAQLDRAKTLIQGGLAQDAQAAAGTNVLISRREQAEMPSSLLKAAIDSIRETKGPGAKVNTKEATEGGFAVMEELLGRVNQAEGPGAKILSAREVKALHAINAEAGERAARAYEVLTGRQISFGPEVPNEPALLPAAARETFRTMMRDYGLVPEGTRVRVGETTGDDASGYSFNYVAGDKQGSAFAKLIDGAWFLAPSRIEDRDYQNVKRAALEYFDAEFARDMREWGASDAEIAAARAATKPTRVFFPGESDPHNYVEDYPLVFQIANETGSDHGIYAGYRPESGQAELYAFN